ncbi:MAG: hypothetical protein WB709_02800 [Solirubrobacteraceae bacterium]
MSAQALTPEVARAIQELELAFPGQVTFVGEEAGGAVVCLTDTQLSERWAPREGQLWFLIPYHYPDAAIYPYYVIGSTPTGGIIRGLQEVSWRGMPATQVSLRHNAWDPAVDNAVGSVLQTRAWLRSR